MFDWGGTLTPHHEVDLLDLWRVAARVLAPDREHEVADALAAAEREWWRRADDGGHESGTTDDVLALAHTKPHAEAFAAALGALGVEPGEAVMVGDRPRDDIAGAKAAGMRAVLRPNPFVPAGPVEPDAVIGSLGELLRVVEAWSA